MTTTREFVPVQSAAAYVNRSPRTIYRWMRTRNVRTRDTGQALEVRLADVARIAGSLRRGRPRGTTRGPR